MGFWNKDEETGLERELRAQRPQPRDEFVRLLTDQITPMPRPRRVAMPKLALVAAVTAALVASLGAAGAFGAARGPVRSFSVSVVHLVAPPKAGNNSASSDLVTTTTTSNGDTDYSNATPTHFPFQGQYGHRIPICWHGQIIYVTPHELIWYFFHGGRPASFCRPGPHHR